MQYAHVAAVPCVFDVWGPGEPSAMLDRRDKAARVQAHATPRRRSSRPCAVGDIRVAHRWIMAQYGCTIPAGSMMVEPCTACNALFHVPTISELKLLIVMAVHLRLQRSATAKSFLRIEGARLRQR